VDVGCAPGLGVVGFLGVDCDRVPLLACLLVLVLLDVDFGVGDAGSVFVLLHYVVLVAEGFRLGHAFFDPGFVAALSVGAGVVVVERFRLDCAACDRVAHAGLLRSRLVRLVSAVHVVCILWVV